MATAYIEHRLDLKKLQGGIASFATTPLDMLRGPDAARAVDIDVYEWHCLGRPVEIVVSVEIP